MRDKEFIFVAVAFKRETKKICSRLIVFLIPHHSSVILYKEVISATSSPQCEMKLFSAVLIKGLSGTDTAAKSSCSTCSLGDHQVPVAAKTSPKKVLTPPTVLNRVVVQRWNEVTRQQAAKPMTSLTGFVNEAMVSQTALNGSFLMRDTVALMQ